MKRWIKSKEFCIYSLISIVAIGLLFPNEMTFAVGDIEPPTVIKNIRVTLDEGDSVGIGIEQLESDDLETDNSTLIYTITNRTSNGEIEKDGIDISYYGTFTQQDLIEGKIRYVHDGHNSTSDSFIFKVADTNFNEWTGHTFSITINPIDDDTPYLMTNNSGDIGGLTGTDLNEGETHIISNYHLESGDDDTDNLTLIYTLTTPFSYGYFELTNNPGVVVNQFVQKNLDDGEVLYVNDGSNTTSDKCYFSISDPVGNTLENQWFEFVIIPVDDDVPTMLTNATDNILYKGGLTVVNIDNLSATDADTDDAALIYTITSPLSHGYLELTSASGVSINQFTQQDLLDNIIRHVHDGSDTTYDEFTFTVSDPTGNALTNQLFKQVITSLDYYAPRLETNSGLNVVESDEVTIESIKLSATDGETNDADIRYKVTTLPSEGILKLNNISIVTDAIFTQNDINLGNVTYDHDGSGGSTDYFKFTLIDHDNNERVQLRVDITIEVTNDAPIIDVNKEMSVSEGGKMPLTTGVLSSSDEESESNDNTYTITSIPAHGKVIHATSGELITVFTQADLADNKILYQHNGLNDESDQFTFTLTDATGIEVTNQIFMIKIAPTVKPVMASVHEGSFSGSISVQLTSETVDAKIFYTLDGSDPVKSVTTSAGTTMSTMNYSGSITINSTTTLKAIGIKDGLEDSQIIKVIFTKRENSSSGSSNSSKSNRPSKEKSIPQKPKEVAVVASDATGEFSIGTKHSIGTGVNIETVIQVSEEALRKELENIKSKETPDVIVLAVAGDNKTTRVNIPSGSVIEMASQNRSIEVSTQRGSYTLPMKLIDFERVLGKSNQQLSEGEITLSIIIKEPSTQAKKAILNAISKTEMVLVVPPVSFEVIVVQNGKEYSVDRYTQYVSRKIFIPEGVDAQSISTAVVIDKSGKMRSVPMVIKEVDGVQYAFIKSLTNSTYALVQQSCNFEDIDESYWACDAIQTLADQLIVSGENTTIFSPEKEVTRAETIEVIIKALGINPEASKVFIDVQDYNFLTAYVDSAYDYGVVYGNEEKLFKPFDHVTRQDVMLMLYRASELIGSDNSVEIRSLSDYEDVSMISDYAREAMAWSLENELLPYISDGELSPQNTLTKAELAVTINAFMKKIQID